MIEFNSNTKLQDFLNFLSTHKIQRFSLTWSPTLKKLQFSHKILQPLAEWVQNWDHDFEEHEGAYFEYFQEAHLLFSAFLHKTTRGQGQGGTRYWHYPLLENYLRDGFRLSAGMTRKNALAGLWWGGGKGVISESQNQNWKNDPKLRKKLFESYGLFVSSLKGVYVTAEDVGTKTEDIGWIHNKTRFVTCIPEEIGGSGNPSPYTASGVCCGIRHCLKYLNLGSISGKKFLVQGLGNVALPLIQELLDAGAASVSAVDVFEHKVQEAISLFSGKNFKAKKVDPKNNSWIEEEVDVFVPCATGGILNQETIPKLKAKIICGAANNQLNDPKKDEALLEKTKILYAPDFIVNRMGIVHCANEQYGKIDPDPALDRHFDPNWEYSIPKTLDEVFEHSKKFQKGNASSALVLADQKSNKSNPIFNERGLKIHESLAKSWHLNASEFHSHNPHNEFSYP